MKYRMPSSEEKLSVLFRTLSGNSHDRRKRFRELKRMFPKAELALKVHPTHLAMKKIRKNREQVKDANVARTYVVIKQKVV
jgi:hypothetical protein